MESLQTMERTLTVESVTEPNHWYAALKHAVDECERRNPGDYPAGKVLEELIRRLEAGSCVCLIVIDESTKKPRTESVCGLVVIDFWEDTLGKKVAFLTMAWADARYSSEPIDRLSTAIDALAKEAGCASIMLYASRNQAAYEKWIGQWGYTKMADVYRKKVE